MPARYLVTGAGGWPGQATLEMLDEALGERVSGLVHAFASTGREHLLRSGRRIRLKPLAELCDLPVVGEPTYLAHYAFLTREKTADRPLATYVAANRSITELVVREARRLGVEGSFVTSSGAVYTSDGSLSRSVADNPYGALKVEEEQAFAALSDDGSRAAICRIFNLAGPFINKPFALSSFLGAALAGRDIRIESDRPVLRSYVHVRDVVAVGFAGMLGPGDGSAGPFDTAGDEVVELAELARRVLAVLDRHDLSVSRPLMSPTGADRYVGDGATFRARAAAAGLALASLDDQIRDTAVFMAEGSQARNSPIRSHRSPSSPQSPR